MTLCDFIAKQGRMAPLIAFALAMAGCQQNPPTPEQAQYASTLRVCPPGYAAESGPYGMAGFRCIKRVAN